MKNAPRGLPHDIGTIITSNESSTSWELWPVLGLLATLALLAGLGFWLWRRYKKRQPAQPWDSIEQELASLEKQFHQTSESPAAEHSTRLSNPQSFQKSSQDHEALYRQARGIVTEARRLHGDVGTATESFLAKTDRVIYEGLTQRFSEADLAEVSRIVEQVKAALIEQRNDRITRTTDRGSTPAGPVATTSSGTDSQACGRSTATGTDLLDLPSDRISSPTARYSLMAGHDHDSQPKTKPRPKAQLGEDVP